MEETTITPQATTASLNNYELSFHGNGKEYFGVVIVNWLLTVVTLGFYYPWAKARQLQYLYGTTALNDDRFTFHGTGQEMFKGFIKALLIFGTIYGLFFLFTHLEMPLIGLLILYAGMIGITPLALHGSYRYRMSRTSWRGIRFGYRGDKGTLTVNFFKWTLLTIVTLGIYGAWMSMNLRKYLLGNVRLGSLEFNYKGDGEDYFVLNLKGYFLTLFTLGIYMAWWQKDMFAYYVDHLSVHKDDREVKMRSTATGLDFLKLMLVNILIFIFTLGFGYAWVVTRTMNLMVSKIEIEGDIDLNNIHQTEDIFNDATGEDMGDLLDIDFVI